MPLHLKELVAPRMRNLEVLLLPFPRQIWPWDVVCPLNVGSFDHRPAAKKFVETWDQRPFGPPLLILQDAPISFFMPFPLLQLFHFFYPFTWHECPLKSSTLRCLRSFVSSFGRWCWNSSAAARQRYDCFNERKQRRMYYMVAYAEPFLAMQFLELTWGDSF
jgi:hypothetical protein